MVSECQSAPTLVFVQRHRLVASTTRLFGLLKVRAKRGDVFLLLLDWAFADLKRKLEYSGSSRVPTPLGLAKTDKAPSLYPSTPQA